MKKETTATLVVSRNRFDYRLKKTDKEAYMKETRKFKARKEEDKPWKGTWDNQTVTIKELVEYIEDNRAFIPIESIGDTTGDSSFGSSQVVSMDFDNGDTPEAVLEALTELNIHPNIMYTTASDTFEHRRFRVVVFLNKATYSIEDYRKYLYGLLVELDKCGVKLDTRTTNASHCYYPGKEVFYIQDKNITDVEAFEAIKKVKTEKDNVTTQWQLDEAQKEADKLGMDIVAYYKHIGKRMPKKRKSLSKYSLNNIEDLELAKMEFIEEAEERAIKFAERRIDHTTDATEKIISAFIEKDVKRVKELVGTFEEPNGWNQMSYKEREDAIKITDVFGLELERNICCILPGHNETNPSANVTVAPDGAEIYKCFGCNSTYRLTTLVQELTGYNMKEASNFLSDVTGLRFMSPYQETSILSISMMKGHINDVSFVTNYPNLEKLMKKWRIMPTYMMMLDVASKFVPVKSLSNNESHITFFCPQSKLANISKNYRPNGKANMNMHYDIMALCDLGLLNKEADIREDVQSYAREIQMKASEKAKRVLEFHTDFYTMPISVNVLEKAENIAKQLLEVKARKRMISVAQSIVVVGEERVKENRPQQNVDGKKAERIGKAFQKSAIKVIERQGYATEEDVVREYYERTGRKKRITAIQKIYDKNRTFLMDGSYFEHKTVNKSTRQVYNIPSDVKSRKVIFVAY